MINNTISLLNKKVFKKNILILYYETNCKSKIKPIIKFLLILMIILNLKKI